MRIRIAPTAFKDMEVASEWWLRNRLAAPRLLEQELRDALAQLAETPFAGHLTKDKEPAFRHVRRLYLPATRYFLYYRVVEKDGVVDVLRLWHASRGGMPKMP